MKFYSHKKGGAGKVLANPKEGTQSFGVVYKRVFEVLTILEGEHKRFLPFKRGGAYKVLICLERVGAKCLGPAIFPFCSPPPPPFS